MPLYNLVCIATRNPESLESLKTLVKISASIVSNNGGVVRSAQFWGRRALPQRKLTGDGEHTMGDYWSMTFDANPPTLKHLQDRLRVDPRVLQWTTLKISSKFKDIVNPPTDPTVNFPMNPSESKV